MRIVQLIDESTSRTPDSSAVPVVILVAWADPATELRESLQQRLPKVLVLDGPVPPGEELDVALLELERRGRPVFVLLLEGSVEEVAASPCHTVQTVNARDTEEVAAAVSGWAEAASAPREGEGAVTRMVILLRHGELDLSSPRFPDDGTRGLSRRGRAQIHLAAEALRIADPDLVIASAFSRARESAAIIAGALGHEVVVNRSLNERGFPPLYGLTTHEILGRYGQDFLDLLNRAPDDVALSGVETLEEASARVVTLLDEVRGAAAHRPLLVGHGGPFSWIACHALGLDVRLCRRFTMAPGSMSVFSLDPLRCVSWNTYRLPTFPLLASQLRLVGGR